MPQRHQAGSPPPLSRILVSWPSKALSSVQGLPAPCMGPWKPARSTALKPSSFYEAPAPIHPSHLALPPACSTIHDPVPSISVSPHCSDPPAKASMTRCRVPLIPLLTCPTPQLPSFIAPARLHAGINLWWNTRLTLTSDPASHASLPARTSWVNTGAFGVCLVRLGMCYKLLSSQGQPCHCVELAAGSDFCRLAEDLQRPAACKHL